MTRAVSDLVQCRCIVFGHIHEVLFLRQVYLVRFRRVIRRTPAVADRAFRIAPKANERFRAGVLSRRVVLHLLAFRDALDDVAVEHAVIFSERIHVLIHIVRALFRRHAVQCMLVERLFGFLIPKFKIFNGNACAFAEALPFCVRFEVPTLIFHLLIGQPTVVRIPPLHRGEQQKDTVYSVVLFARDRRYRRPSARPALLPQPRAFFEVFQDGIYEQLPLRRQFVIRRSFQFIAQSVFLPPPPRWAFHPTDPRLNRASRPPNTLSGSEFLVFLCFSCFCSYLFLFPIDFPPLFAYNIDVGYSLLFLQWR